MDQAPSVVGNAIDHTAQPDPQAHRQAPSVADGYHPPPDRQVTVGKTAAMRDDWYMAVKGHLREAQGGADAKKLSYALMHEQSARQPRPEDRDKHVIDDAELEQTFDRDLPRQLVARTAAALGTPLDQTALDVRDRYIRHVNHKQWTPLENEITEPGGQKLTSRMTPVNETYDPTYAPLGKTGLGSMSGRLTPDKRTPEEKTRPVNLWKTELERDDKTLFEGFRSGAFVDTASDPGERQANARARGKGVLEAVLIDELKKMTPEARQRYLSGQSTFDGNLVSIDLLSGAGGDKRLAEQHHDTLHDLNRKKLEYDIEMDGGTHKVPATFNIMDFMTGVNAMNTKLGPLPSFGLSKDSGAQEKANQGSWGALTQHAKAAQSFFNGTPGPEGQARLAKINALVGGVEETGLGSSGGYQLPAMLANLSHELGIPVHFNCKSGKDRTGIMDSETKYMARQLDKQRGTPGPMAVPNVSDPGKRDATQSYEHDQMLWEGGNLDILAQNVGGQCLKTADVAKLPMGSDKRLKDNLGGSEMLKELGGLKRYADIDTIASFEKKTVTQKLEPMSDKEKAAYAASGREYVDGLPAPKPLPRPPAPQYSPQPPPQHLPIAPQAQAPQGDGYVQATAERLASTVNHLPQTLPKGVPPDAKKYF